MQLTRRSLTFSLALAAAGCGGSTAGLTDTGQADTGTGGDSAPADATRDALADSGTGPAPSFAVDPAWLTANIGSADVQVVDVRGQTAWEASRIAGAIGLNPSTLSATVAGITGQVAPAADGQIALRAAGIRGDGTIVVYDDSTTMTAARVIWTLHYYGHPDVRVLDGGFAAWTAASGMTDTGPITPAPSTFTVAAVDTLRVGAPAVLAILADPAYSIVDARSPTEYTAGHIPGALSVNWPQNLVGGAFRPAAEVEALYATIPRTNTVISYCQSGRRASMTWLSLKWLGYADVRLYDGSWNEWGADPTLPRE